MRESIYYKKTKKFNFSKRDIDNAIENIVYNTNMPFQLPKTKKFFELKTKMIQNFAKYILNNIKIIGEFENSDTLITAIKCEACGRTIINHHYPHHEWDNREINSCEKLLREHLISYNSFRSHIQGAIKQRGSDPHIKLFMQLVPKKIYKIMFIRWANKLLFVANKLKKLSEDVKDV